MSQAPEKISPQEISRRRRRWRIAAWFALIAIVLGGTAGIAYFQYNPPDLGPKQPIPFSHHFHVSTKQISCFMCHSSAAVTDRAGVPPLETCMLCHSKIIIDYPYIRQLREHYVTNQPVQWVHVNNRVPEFVYFSHQRHVRSGIDCGKCHGDVAQMDRVYAPIEIDMGFCVQCHKENNFSHDCYTCHR